MESEDALRPNIRIEIHNNLVDAMDTEEDNKLSDGEDGEIIDSSELGINEDINILERPTNNMWSNQRSIEATTNSNKLMDEDELAKFEGRAKRFALKPNEMQNFTSEQMQELFDSLGIADANDKNIHFHSLHMHGTDAMATEDVFEYFGKYAPVCVEWVSDESCNVVWGDYNAAKALYYLSQPVAGMPVEVVGEAKKIGGDGRSILLKNRDRVVEIQGGDYEGVKLSDIAIQVPLGYWRLGQAHDKAKWVLLRFALKSDAKPYKAEHVVGGIKGLVSESAKLRYKGIFNRNREIEDEEVDVKNPWGSLAKHWNEDIQFAEREPQHLIPITHTKMAQKNPALQHRLGFKRAHKSEEKLKADVEVVGKVKAPRMRMYADEEEANVRRKRQLQALQSNAIKEECDDDLRKRLPVRRLIADPVLSEVNQGEPDLGAKLKNRVLKQAAIQIKDSTHVNYRGEAINARDILTAKRQRNGSDLYNQEVRSRLDARNLLGNERNADARDRLHTRNNDRLSNRFTSDDRHELAKMSKQDRLGALLSNDERGSNSSSKTRSNEQHARLSSRNKQVHTRGVERRNKSPQFSNRMRSDQHQTSRNKESSRTRDDRDSDYEDSDDLHTDSKVTVVIKKRRAPAVASTVWSRINSEQERLKTVSEGKLRVRKDSSSSNSSSDSSSSSSSASSSADERMAVDAEEDDAKDGAKYGAKYDAKDAKLATGFKRPGFTHFQTKLGFSAKEHSLSPLRIEINNDHFKK